jgi:PAP2 superfamily
MPKAVFSKGGDVFANLRDGATGLALGLFAITTAWGTTPPSVVATWNAAALEEVRQNRFGPPVVARALAIAHTCMYDAWVPYDARAVALVDTTERRPANESNDANKAKAVSYAAYRCLLNLFPSAAPRLDAVMKARGYDPADTSTNLATPQGIGNAAAAAVIASRRNDGANQYGDLAAGAYSDYTGFTPANAPMPFCLPTTPGNCNLNITDASRWQPLTSDTGAVQRFIAPFWENVRPFALSSATQFDSLPVVAAGPNYLRSPALLQADIDQVVAASGALTPQQKLVVEYWADGPASELPPGHWGLFAQFVSKRDANSIDEDVKMFFAMHNASFDAGIVAWHLKRKYQGVRPITAVRQARQGRTLFAWGGPGRPNQNIEGGKWTPYNPGSNLTPAFPGYISGHSTFSAASAAALRAFTGSDNFGFSTVIPADFGRVEPGVPAVPTTLRYASFTAAEAEAGASRILAGIHFADDNTVGLDLGRRIGEQASGKAQFLFDGGLNVAATSMGSSAKTNNLTWQHTVDAQNDRLLVVGVTVDNGSNAVQSVSYGGAPLSRLGSQASADKDVAAELWYRIAPAVGTAAVVVRMHKADDLVAGATTYVGVNQRAPFGTFRAATAHSDQACVTTANEPAALVTTVQAVKGNAKGIFPGRGQIGRWLGLSNESGKFNDKFGSGEVIGKGATYKAAPMTAICSPLSAAADWAVVAVPLKPAF